MHLITIGKDESNNIQIEDISVSRFHLQMVIDDDKQVTVIDLSSTNGTYINGQRIYSPTILDKYDILLVGSNPFDWKRQIIEIIDDTDVKERVKEAIIEEEKKIKDKSVIDVLIGVFAIAFILIIIGVVIKNN
jgi:pSer/pThr/pTyr-binding forkhead associated (FHA) protein